MMKTWLGALCALAIVLGGCAAEAPPKKVEVVVDDALSFDAAMDAVATSLATQLTPPPVTGAAGVLANVRAELEKSMGRAQPVTTVSVDPFVDAQNGYAIVVGQKIQSELSRRLAASLKNTEFISLTADGLAKSAQVMAGSVGFEERGGGRGKAYRLNVSMTDAKTGLLSAQASAWLADRNLDMASLPVYQDSPVFLNDKYTQGLIATTRAKVGTAADRTWFSQLSTSSLVAEAQQAFSADDTRRSLALYQRAEIRPDGKTLKTYAGLYVNHLKMGSLNDAEKVFGQLIAVAFSENNLSIKFLFGVNSTEFINDSRLTPQYRIWARQLAQHISRTQSCVEVLGHSSKSGNEAYNTRLSLQRAEALRQVMRREAPESLNLTRATGRGFLDNIVGTGSDDERDAIDRRVEFRIINCNLLRS